MNWYYALDQQRIGPVPEEQLASLAKEGRLTGATLVWNEGLPGWKPLSEVRPDLLSAAGAGEEMEFCAVSGKAYPRSQMVQYEGKWISAEHREAFFQRLREGVGIPGEMAYAGFWIRFVAKFIDGIVVWIVSMLKSLVLVLLMFGHMNVFVPSANPAENMPLFLAYQGVNFVTDIAIGILYSWFFLSRFQATPGKMALGLKVVRADGSKLQTPRIIGRYFGEMLSGFTLGIGYIMAGLDEPEKRALHDRVCDTRVIKSK